VFFATESLLIVILLLLPSRRWAKTLRAASAAVLLCCPFACLYYGVGQAIWQHETPNPPGLEKLIEPLCHILMAFAFLAIVAAVGSVLICLKAWSKRIAPDITGEGR
jgi:hypothetical protein